MLKFFCPRCGKVCEEAFRPVRCQCGSPLKSSLDWKDLDIDASAPGMWRYSGVLPPVDRSVSMGEGWTPMISGGSRNLFYKLEYVSPTGSFKDRGAAIVMGEAKSLGCGSVVEDSSGNAGASVAAYASRSGIKATIVFPRNVSEQKRRQFELYGAELVEAEGGRKAAAEMAMEMARSTFYASHVWNPLFLEGTRTIAFEIWEQLGKRAPETVIVPAGNGTILLGIFKGFKELLQRVKINRLPKIIAVQSENCCPLFDAWKGTSTEPYRNTVSEGIAVGDPPRMKEMIDAVRISRGDVVTVGDEAVLAERKRLAVEGGLFVEPSAAVAPAAERMLRESGKITEKETVVVPLTGTGLKGTYKQ